MVGLPITDCSSLEVVKLPRDIVSSKTLSSKKVYLYNAKESEIISVYSVKSGLDFTSYAKEIAEDWIRTTGSPMSNITSDSEFKSTYP